jgi:uncharacterized membrane protein (UPF0127 family)
VDVLVNQSTGETLARHVIRCDTFWRRLRGLMFRRRVMPDEAYLFVFRGESVLAASVHTLFVFCPISLIWLDARQKVVDLRLARPFRLYYAPRRAARYLVEGAPGWLDGVQVGDRLEF